MASVELRIEHALGAAAARARIAAAAAELRAKNAGLVSSLEWAENRAHVAGKGFHGSLEVEETCVKASVELEGLLAVFPLKARRELEGWLQRVLGTAT